MNISSVGGKVAMATYGPYAGTKFALEAVSDALRREVAEFGVKVVVIEPGAVQTEIAERGFAAADRLNDRPTAAKVIAKAATASRPRTRYSVGRDAAIMVRLVRVMPDRLLDRILRLGLRPHHVKTSQPRAVMTARSR